MTRYVVLGLDRDIEAWRRERGIPPREVIGVSTRDGERATRGLWLPPEAEIITLPSWSQASQRMRDAVALNLEVAHAVYRPAG